MGRGGPPPRLLVGLGNPGEEYARTRHNVGFRCIDRLADSHRISMSDRRATAVIGQGEIAGVAVALARPRTYVNRTGQAVRYLLDRFRASPADLLIIYDDMNVSLGKLRLRPDGSSGGHNGINSIIEATGTQAFPRLRIGIGAPGSTAEHVDYVLGSMTDEEEKTVREAVDRAAEAVAVALSEGIDAAMNRFN